MFYLYILQSASTGRYYVGQTKDRRTSGVPQRELFENR